MPGKTDYVKVAVEPEKKDRWEEAVSDTPNVGTLSGLVRLAVEQHIGGNGHGADGASEEVAENLSELVEQNRQVINRLDGLEVRLSTVEQAVQQDPDVQALANDVFAVLPTKEQVEDDGLPDQLPEEHGGPTANSGTVEDIAALVDASELKVQQALDKLQADTARVPSDDGRYWKEV